MLIENPTLQFFYDTLPEKPYCTNDLQKGLFIREREQAMKQKYIQPNSPFDLYWFVFDIDRPTAHFDWEDRKVPAPNISVMNPKTGNAHLIYGIERPVIKREYNLSARLKPIKYAAAIENALTVTLDADKGYSGLICKNPLHNYWITYFYKPYLYDLSLLAEGLKLQPYIKAPIEIGLGRNCTLFDDTRKWAYSEFRKVDFSNVIINCCIEYAWHRNQIFIPPLPYREVKSIGKSAGKWVLRNFDPAGLRQWHSTKGKAGNIKSIQVRQAAAEIRNAEIIEYAKLNPRATYREISHIFNVSLGMISSITKLKKEYEYVAN